MGKKTHFKTRSEELTEDILVMLILFVLFGGVRAVYFLWHGENPFKIMYMKSGMPDPSLLLCGYMVLDIVFMSVKYVILCVRRRIILTNGTAYEGSIIGTAECIKKHTRGGTYFEYRYAVGLPDGRQVRTELYGEDIVLKYHVRKCTVYEYCGRFYFTDFIGY